jgi:hypothetical protein
MLYSVRSERLLMEEMDYNLLFCWFVGLNAADEVWDATTFTKNRDRLLETDGTKGYLLARKSSGKESKLSYSGNLLVENRNGLIIDAEVF